MTLVQSPDDAEYDGMPRAAIETGMVDMVLPVAEIPQKLLDLWRTARQVRLPDIGDDNLPPSLGNPVGHTHQSETLLEEILERLHVNTGHDFQHYKRATVLRRMERRLHITGQTDLAAYLRYLEQHPEESAALLADMLIGVTNFFRDREAFESLERHVLPQLVGEPEDADGLAEVRVWSAGCSTGEEAYSLAMLVCEQLALDQREAKVQVFASDLDARAIEIARIGTYPEAILTDVPPARLRQFFVNEDQHYRVRKEIREKVLFARHNLLSDPPFSQIGLIVCRNLLIYLDREVQREILQMFHFALRPGGYLFLGSSESADAGDDLFVAVDKRTPISGAREVRPIARRSGRQRPDAELTQQPLTKHAVAKQGRKHAYAEIHHRALALRTPPSLIVDLDGNILHMSEGVGRFLQVTGGEPSRNLINLVLPPLRLALRSTLFQARQGSQSITSRAIEIGEGQLSRQIEITVQPHKDEPTGADCLLVVFEERQADAPLPEPAGIRQTDSMVLNNLERELQRTRQQLQETIEQSEISSEELTASNQEMQVINEELRSASEELETSKEELQSINEELTTVNYELKSKVDETSKINDDLQNLISSTDIATVFVDRKMRIKWFTPRARDIFNVIGNDAGRSLFDITHRLDYPLLAKDAAEAFEELHLVEREVRDREGQHWYLARFLPYRTLDDRIEGAVLTFIDISDRRRAEEELRAGEAHLKLLAQSTKGYAIITLDCDGLITTWNCGAELILGYRETEVLGQTVDIIYTEQDRQAGVPEAERQRALQHGQATDERWHARRDGSRCFLSGLLNPLVDGTGKVIGFAKIARDLTEERQRSSEQQNELESVQAANLQKDQFFAVLSHELKHPLNLIQLNTDLVARSQAVKNNPSLHKATQSIQNAVRSQSRIIDDLMDVSRIRTGKLKLHFATLRYQDVLRGIEAVFAPLAQSENISFESFKPDAPIYIQADPTRLDQIIWNLLNNAWKFSKGGERICMQLEREGDQARLDVIDTGEGISADFLPKVFDMFGQAEMQHAQRAKHGLGIGLALVKQLVEAHNGRIEAYSEGIGRGARFSVWLPVHLQTELELSDLANADAAGGLRGIRILLVDDSPDILETMCELLQSEGAEVTTADGGARAIELAEQTPFDVIVSDIGMPEIDGHKMMAIIRQQGANRDTPSIALTGYGTLRDVEKAMAAGFTLHLRKPIDLQALIDAVSQAVH